MLGKGLMGEDAFKGVLKTELEVLREVRGQGTFQAKENPVSKRRKRHESSPCV